MFVVYNMIKQDEQWRTTMNPKGYRKSDEREFGRCRHALINPDVDSDVSFVPKDAINKFNSGTLGELKDPARKNEKVIRKEEIFDLQLDLYLFGKGRNINE